MDIKAEIEKIIAQLTKDGDLKDKFMKDPAGTVRGIVGDQADDDTIKKIIETVKDAISKGGLSGIGEKISDMIGGLFGKKDDDAKIEKKDDKEEK